MIVLAASDDFVRFSTQTMSSILKNMFHKTKQKEKGDTAFFFGVIGVSAARCHYPTHNAPNCTRCDGNRQLSPLIANETQTQMKMMIIFSLDVDFFFFGN